MIRFTLRQFRFPLLVAGTGLAIVAVVLGVTGPGLAHLYQTTVADCASRGNCGPALAAFDDRDHFLQITVQALPLVVPVILGMFWGAPLVARELEEGTFRLAWTQGRSRRQWLGAKLLVVGGATVVVEGLLSLMATWWWSSIALAHPNRFSPALFGIFGVVAIGYAAFAFALGLAAGTILRRLLPAMGTTLVAFIAVRLAVTFWIRPNFASPAQRTFAIDPNGGFGIMSSNSGPLQVTADPPALPNAWIRSNELVDASGRQPSGNVLDRLCPAVVRTTHESHPAPLGLQRAFQACTAKVAANFHQVLTYQPASHYWPFQWAELALFVAAAAALCALSYWWVRHRLT